MDLNPQDYFSGRQLSLAEVVQRRDIDEVKNLHHRLRTKQAGLPVFSQSIDMRSVLLLYKKCYRLQLLSDAFHSGDRWFRPEHYSH